MSLSITSASSSASAGRWYRLVSACGVRTYSAWVPSMVLPRIHPPVRQCEYIPLRHASHFPHALMHEMSTLSPARNVDTERTDGLDHADAFVPENPAGRDRRDVALHDVQVRAADRRRRDPHDGIPGSRITGLGFACHARWPGPP